MKVALLSIVALLFAAAADAEACKVKEDRSKRMARRAPPIDRPVAAPEAVEATPATPAPAVEEAKPAPVTEPAKPAEPAPAPVKPIAEEPAKPEVAPTKGPGKFANEVHFPVGKDSLTAPVKKTLDGVAKWLAANPSEKITIEGHADTRGTDEINQTLSEARAQAVKAYLESQGVESGRLETVGFGETKPKYPGADGRNRRAMLVKQ
jgi:OmpA-OmpF porin, OOP family